jgi:hypothetical protein
MAAPDARGAIAQVKAGQAAAAARSAVGPDDAGGAAAREPGGARPSDWQGSPGPGSRPRGRAEPVRCRTEPRQDSWAKLGRLPTAADGRAEPVMHRAGHAGPGAVAVDGR